MGGKPNRKNGEKFSNSSGAVRVQAPRRGSHRTEKHKINHITYHVSKNVTWFFLENLIKKLFNLFWHSIIVKIDHGFSFFFQTVSTVF